MVFSFATSYPTALFCSSSSVLMEHSAEHRFGQYVFRIVFVQRFYFDRCDWLGLFDDNDGSVIASSRLLLLRCYRSGCGHGTVLIGQMRFQFFLSIENFMANGTRDAFPLRPMDSLVRFHVCCHVVTTKLKWKS